MLPYSKIYDNKRFLQGFSLIEKQSDENQSIAVFLVERVEELFRKRKSLNVLDLAGGSGSVWKLVNDLLNKKGILASKELKVCLIDSSEKQVSQAKSLNLPWLEAAKGDASTYLENLKEKFDLITCIHFFSGLPKEKQFEIFASCQNALNKGGVWFGVQPSVENPLSLAKIELIKKVTGFDYQPNYTIPLGSEVAIKRSILKIQESQLLSLAYFLVASYVHSKELDKDVVSGVFEKFVTRRDEELEIVLLNDCLVWKKTQKEII